MYLKNENSYVPFNGTVVRELERGIYKLVLEQSTHKYHLEYYENEFSLPRNLIEIRKDDKEYLLDSIMYSNDNIGMLFTGTKGSGKTVMAKEICNKLNYPVILVEGANYNDINNMFSFLSELKSSAIYMFDEFDKYFTDSNYFGQERLLTFMDGLYNNNEYRKIFILTANSTYDINQNFFSRPSRLMYKLDFTNIDSKSEIINIFNSYLNDNSDKTIKLIIDFLESKGKLNLDTILAVIKEVNKLGIERFMKVGSHIINIEDDIISCDFEVYGDKSVTSIPFDKFVDDYLNGKLSKDQMSSNETTSIHKLPSKLLINDVFDGYSITKVINKNNHVFIETDKRGKQYNVITNSFKISKLL